MGSEHNDRGCLERKVTVYKATYIVSIVNLRNQLLYRSFLPPTDRNRGQNKVFDTQ